MLGAPANKELWPRSIWPVPSRNAAHRASLQLLLPGDWAESRQRFNALIPPERSLSSFLRTDFSSGLFSIFTAGNFGSDIAFWVDDDISVSGDNAAGGLGDAYLKFVNIGRFMKMPKDSL